MRLSEYDIECIRKAKTFIDEDKATHHVIPEIAAHTGISRTKLKAAFKQLYGMGLYKYLTHQRLQKGKYLIENTRLTLKQISHAMGYNYVNNFSAAFKKRFGKTARQWQNDTR